MRRFRIEPDVEFVPGSVDELGVGSLRIQTGAHEDHLFRKPGKFGIDRDGQRQVGHRAAGVNRYLIRIFTDHADQKVRCVFGSGLGSGLAFRHFSQLVRRMIELWSPRSQPGYGAMALLPKFRFFLRSYQRILRSRHNRDVSASDQFEHAQSVSDFRLEPLIARDHCDAQDFGLRRLNE